MIHVVEFMIVRKGYKDLYNPCGSDYTVIIRDLKTLKGIKNRIKNYMIPKDVVQIRIYRVSSVTDRETYNLIDTIDN